VGLFDETQWIFLVCGWVFEPGLFLLILFHVYVVNTVPQLLWGCYMIDKIGQFLLVWPIKSVNKIGQWCHMVDF